MRILISGSTGLVGTALIPRLKSRGDEIVVLVRRESDAGEGRVFWNPERGEIDAPSLNGIDAVIHLAGENISAGRWTVEQKARIKDSRVVGTSFLSKTVAQMSTKPNVMISASAIGFYGDRGDEVVDEESEPGKGFMADVCKAWELASKPASDAGIRVVNPRIGIVLSTKGGALAKLLTPFRMGAGGPVGNGKQYMSWIEIDDLVAAILFLLDHDNADGAINIVAPNPVTNADFAKTLGKVLSRPAFFPLPAFAVRLMFGEMGDALLLGSTRVVPTRLQLLGFQFGFPLLKAALENLLQK